MPTFGCLGAIYCDASDVGVSTRSARPTTERLLDGRRFAYRNANARLGGDDDLPAGVVPRHAGDRGRCLGEWIDVVRDHLDLARLEERRESLQVLAVHDAPDELHVRRPL